MNRLLKLIKPNWQKMFLFVLFAFLMPVPILTREPISQISNDTMIWKYHISESIFTLFVGGHASGFNVFIGVIEGDYFTNLLGLPLLLVYYLTACAIFFMFQSKKRP